MTNHLAIERTGFQNVQPMDRTPKVLRWRLHTRMETVDLLNESGRVIWRVW